MASHRTHSWRAFCASIALVAAGTVATAEPQHGIAMYGDPALPHDFVSLPYANPDAPTGGRMVTAEVGGFDSLNPYITKGSVPWQLRYLVGESLMGRSLDEPFTLYGVLAESIEAGPNREWVEFTLNPAAEFSDGSPVTVEDVIWSFETLGTEGHARYRGFWDKVESLTEVRPGTVRFNFNTADRELALLAGLRPILKKSQWDGVDFSQSSLDIVPITSSPMVIADYEPGRFISLERNPDYWGADIPFRRGTFNLDEIRLEFFGDETPAFEAFTAGEVNFTREFSIARWDSRYNFPAVQAGDVVKSVLAHGRPTGMTGFVMNTRNPLFDDWRVRDAMLHAFNFQIINDAATGMAQPRIESYWGNSPLGMQAGPASGRVAELLAPFANDLLPGTLEGYALPAGDDSQRNRADMGVALAQFEAAGWTIQDGVMTNEAGQPFAFELLLKQGSSEHVTMADIYAQTLESMGISMTIAQADGPQYKERTDAYDFDMTYYRRGVTLSPGNELYLYFGQENVDTPGGRNLMGVESPAMDAMVDQMLNSPSQDDFVASVRAMDRLLTAGRYVIPFYQWNVSRIAHDKNLHHPETMPVMGDWPGWQPDVWWYAEN
ncbi:extracellular solute-binding protein [Yoonia sp. I 8.24]|uniref:extracellular solute-binding protein n=1 Tax=Yoonia sp. I 8.24 TaxID=1537229 RepID=UPI001EDD7DCC|nr:extracellular solute-binding protein [Yoonia sp. I 8.24]